MVELLTRDLHEFFSITLFLIPLYNLYILYTKKNFIALAKRVRLFTPLYFAIIAAVTLTGFNLSAFLRDFNSPHVLIMIFSTLIIFILEIKKYKKIRIIKSKEYDKQKVFIAFAKKKYYLDLFLLTISALSGYYSAFLVF
ncbi:MAG: hypothetical protein ACLFQJ_03140 [Campylobacterales bacterium]